MKKRVWLFLTLILTALLFTAGCGKLGHNFVSNSNDSRNIPNSYLTQPLRAYSQLKEKKTWTVMVYQGGDNNLDDYLFEDFNEMEVVGSKASMNVVVQIDSDNYSLTPEVGTGAGRFYIEEDANMSVINSTLVEKCGEINMADPNNFRDFLRWAMISYPADNYILILSSHGDGWYDRSGSSRSTAGGGMISGQGIIYDDTNSGRQYKLNIHEIKAAMESVVNETGKKIDIIACDACLMAMAEVAYEWKDAGSYLVSSEETIPGEGYPYHTILGEISANISAQPYAIAQKMVDKYDESYSAREDTTLSIIDLSKVAVLGASLKAFSQEFEDQDEPKLQLRLRQKNYVSFYDSSFCDLYDFLESIKTDFSASPSVLAAANEVQSKITDAVPYYKNGNNFSNARGIAIYIPGNQNSLSEYSRMNFGAQSSSGWCGFLEDCFNTDLSGMPSEFSVQLSWAGGSAGTDFDITIQEIESGVLVGIYSPYSGSWPNGYMSADGIGSSGKESITSNATVETQNSKQYRIAIQMYSGNNVQPVVRVYKNGTFVKAYTAPAPMSDGQINSDADEWNVTYYDTVDAQWHDDPDVGILRKTTKTKQQK